MVVVLLKVLSLLTTVVVIQAINSCLDPADTINYLCATPILYPMSPPRGELYFMSFDCGLTDDDLDDLETCLIVAGLQDPPVNFLDLSGNSLTTLPAGIFQTFLRPYLSFLDFSGNDLTTLPEGIFQPLTNLLLLDFAKNNFTTLPRGLFEPLTDLARLVLEDNDLTTLPEGLFDPLTALTELALDGNVNLQCLPATAASTEVDGYTRSATDECECPGDGEDGFCGEDCTDGADGFICGVAPEDDIRDDPHTKGLRGQRIDWSGVDGGWYSLVKDDNAELNINIRLTAPLPEEFPDRQLVTGLTVTSEGHSLVVEVGNPYAVDTDGCPEGISPCLANGGLRITVDGQEDDELLRFSRQVPAVADGAISVSASNLPVECRQFGGDKIWARKYQEFLEGRRRLGDGESLEDWILRFDHHMAAPGWCAKYIAENDLADLQSTHAIFKIETPAVTVRLNAGVNHQGDDELDWDGRTLPDLEFWQMDVGLDGLDIENPALSGILGETARPVYDENGKEVMEGFEAFRGTVEDYRVSGALGVHFALLD